MHERPIGDLVDALNSVGTQIEYTGQAGSRRCISPRPYPCAAHECARQCVEPVPDGAADGGAFDGTGSRCDDRCRRRVDFQALYRDHTQPDAAFRRKRGKDRLAIVYRRGRAALHQSGTIHVEGDASSASYFWRQARSQAGRCGLKASARTAFRETSALLRRCNRWARPSRWRQLDRGEIERRTESNRCRFPTIFPMRHDDCGGGAVCDAPAPCAILLAGASRKPTASLLMATELRKLGATVEEGADYLRRDAATQILAATSIPTTTTAWRCASRWRRWMALRAAATKMRINDPKCVAKLFRKYFDAFSKIATTTSSEHRCNSGLQRIPALVLILQRIFMCRDFGGR